MLRDELFDGFKTASDELFETIENAVIHLENEFTEDHLNKLFRTFHTLKGNCGVMGFTPMRDLSHAVEGMMGDVRKGLMPMSSEVTNLILSSVDHLKQMTLELEKNHDGKIDPSQMVQKIKRYRESAKPASSGNKKHQEMTVKTLDNLAILEIPIKFEKNYATGLVELIKSLAKRGVTRFVYNFMATKSVLPEEIDALASSRAEIDKLGGAIASCGMSDELMVAFNDKGMSRIINIKPSLKQAVDSVKGA